MSDDGLNSTLDRRKFLTVLGVTGGGAAVLSGCSTGKVEKLVPYLVQSEDQVPGVPTWYASTCTECAAGCGLHVKTREGRAIKLEGNPDHPVNAGKLCARGQAGLQGLYNPDRLRGPMLRSGAGFKAISWDEAIARLAAEVGKAAGRVAVVSGAGRGSFADLLAEWTAAAGGRLTRYEPFDHEPMRAANRMVFGTDQLPAHDFGAARYIVSFGADFLDGWLSPVENQRGFARSHGFENGQSSRHVFVGPRKGLTALNADEYLSAAPGTDALVALAMASVLAGGASVPADAASLRPLLAEYTPERVEKETGVAAATIRRIASDFAAAGPSLAVAGGVGSQHRGAVDLCAAVNLLNYLAGNIGKTVLFGADLPAADGYGRMAELMAAMDAGQVGLLLVHEANPAYALPRSAGFGERLKKVGFKVSTSLYLDETAALCDLLLPNHHALERWDDLRPRSGVYGLLQPAMEPVFDTRSTGDVLLQVARKAGSPFARLTAATFEDYLKESWKSVAAAHGGGGDFDAFWRGALAKGGVFGAAAPMPVRLAPGAGALKPARPAFDGDGAYVLVAYPHSLLYDGRGANRPWLLENPDPVSKVTWDSWIEISAAVAARLDVERGEVIRLVSPHGTVEGPAWPYAGLRDDVVAVPLGYGHTEYGRYAKGRGLNPLDLLGPPGTAEFIPYVSTRVRIEKVNTYKALATTEGNPRQLGRHIAEAMPIADARRGLTVRESYVHRGQVEHSTNTPLEVKALAGWRKEQIEMRKIGNYAEVHPSWGLVVDLARCTGCSTCVTACYAENNIPFVGEDEVLRGREMSWMRIERYWEGGDASGRPLEARFVPMLCQQCENAPCEPVCPVYASYHTVDGLNGQVYNRCVGTRYCSNNCPYKVRYFNWYKYNEKAFVEPLNLQLNPEVTVRARGVMEKCTFCVQRIRTTQHTARLEQRAIADGEIVTACAQACPSDAIVFGDLRNPESRVAKLREDPRGYVILEDLNTRPAITYLAKVLQGPGAEA